MKARLDTRSYSRKVCEAAIKGEKIPNELGLPLVRICTIRGIRHYPGFGEELRGVLPEFTRALNARAIMSGSIPDMNGPEEEPYCIWYPDIAEEVTYRKLVARCPSMAYQVGRACAVAGYTNLYLELKLLPEVHIAEEARESGSMAIFDDIMSCPVKYEVMNDYNRTLNTANPSVAHLNGDTAVRRTLAATQQFKDVDDEVVEDDTGAYALLHGEGFNSNPFDITEDMGVDVEDATVSGGEMQRSQVDLATLLTGPLPVDLPTVEKDLLICMAAYYGDIDRYARLRRPMMIAGELRCCVRGIYHNTLFAIWWSKQSMAGITGSDKLRQAIEARYIMNNVLHRVSSKDFRAPYLIWFPTHARTSTYRKLASLKPNMLPQIVRACIVANYEDLFDELVHNVKPDEALMLEARQCSNNHYTKELEKRIELVGLKKLSEHERWKLQTQDYLQQSSTLVIPTAGLPWPECSFDSLYNGIQCDASALELMACLPQEWKISSEEAPGIKELDYVHWPATDI